MREKRDDGMFCRTYLRTMDPEQAAEAVGRRDGFSILGCATVRKRLDRMREDAAGQVRREDVIRRLAQLAFGRANDAVRLALRPGEARVETLDLSAVSEFRVTDKGGVEVKLVDRVKALEALWGLLADGGGHGAEALYQALEEGAAQEGGWENE